VDQEKFAQRFTPRRPGSRVSEMNKERMRRLIKNKLMTAKGLNAVFFDKNEKFAIAPDILKALKENKQTWKNFQRLPAGYKKVRIGYLESQRRHSNGMFQKSLQYFLKMTGKDKKFGMVQ